MLWLRKGIFFLFESYKWKSEGEVGNSECIWGRPCWISIIHSDLHLTNSVSLFVNSGRIQTMPFLLNEVELEGGESLSAFSYIKLI